MARRISASRARGSARTRGRTKCEGGRKAWRAASRGTAVRQPLRRKRTHRTARTKKGNERIEALGHKEDSTTPELGLACCRGELRSLIKFFCEPCFMPEERVKPG